jgi:CheY-like chemotaxis protein
MPWDPTLSETRRRILVVEDNPDHALLVRIAAERVDPTLEVVTCADGRDAVDLLGGASLSDGSVLDGVPDLVLLDLIMPRLDGFAFLEWVRGQPAFEKLPVVVLSSSISPLDEARALRLGASAFHTKPANHEDLGEQVRSVVKRWLT